jgi:hypothetical protein
MFPSRNMKTNIAVIAATLYLIFLSILGYTGISIEVSALIYLVSPLIIIGLVYVVLTEDEFQYPELPSGQEWGYLDKDKGELGLL